jgi:hypothetical protein
MEKNIEINKADAYIMLRLLEGYSADLDEYAMTIINEAGMNSYDEAVFRVRELKAKILNVFPECSQFEM